MPNHTCFPQARNQGGFGGFGRTPLFLPRLCFEFVHFAFFKSFYVKIYVFILYLRPLTDNCIRQVYLNVTHICDQRYDGAVNVSSNRVGVQVSKSIAVDTAQIWSFIIPVNC